MKKIVEIILSRIPYLRYAYFYRKNCRYRPGHYYSPVVDREDLIERNEQIWRKRELKGIDMNEDRQLLFMLDMREFVPVPSVKSVGYRFYFNNGFYGYADSLVLFSVLFSYKPKRVIEVGCGFSSALMLDLNDRLGLHIWFTFIDPNETALRQVLRTEDWLSVAKIKVQNAGDDTFKTLEANDILFIDCSHVSKTGSDVNYLLTEVLPSLNKGVLIHIHDIFYPFEYLPEWVLDLRFNWNEIYAVHNFLLFNDSFEIVFFSDYMQQKYKDGPALFYKDRPGSLWLRKTK